MIMYVMRPRSYSRGLRNRKTYANANFNDNVHSRVRYPSESFGGWDFAPRSRLESYLKIAPDLPFYRDACSRNAGVGMGRFIAARRGRGEGGKNMSVVTVCEYVYTKRRRYCCGLHLINLDYYF